MPRTAKQPVARPRHRSPTPGPSGVIGLAEIHSRFDGLHVNVLSQTAAAAHSLLHSSTIVTNRLDVGEVVASLGSIRNVRFVDCPNRGLRSWYASGPVAGFAAHPRSLALPAGLRRWMCRESDQLREIYCAASSITYLEVRLPDRGDSEALSVPCAQPLCGMLVPRSMPSRDTKFWVLRPARPNTCPAVPRATSDGRPRFISGPRRWISR